MGTLLRKHVLSKKDLVQLLDHWDKFGWRYNGRQNIPCFIISKPEGDHSIIPLTYTTLNVNHIVEPSVLTGHFVQGEPRKASHHGFLLLNGWSIRLALRTV